MGDSAGLVEGAQQGLSGPQGHTFPSTPNSYSKKRVGWGGAIINNREYWAEGVRCTTNTRRLCKKAPSTERPSKFNKNKKNQSQDPGSDPRGGAGGLKEPRAASEELSEITPGSLQGRGFGLMAASGNQKGLSRGSAPFPNECGPPWAGHTHTHASKFVLLQSRRPDMP